VGFVARVQLTVTCVVYASCLYRCEVRSGPEFLLRKYIFYASGRFHLVQFYYADSQCREPAFSVETRGVYRQLHPSWTVRGGTEVDYETTQVAVVAYTNAVATALQQTVNSTCNIGAFRKQTRTRVSTFYTVQYGNERITCRNTLISGRNYFSSVHHQYSDVDYIQIAQCLPIDAVNLRLNQCIRPTLQYNIVSDCC